MRVGTFHTTSSFLTATLFSSTSLPLYHSLIGSGDQSITLYTPNLEPSNLHLHLLNPLSLSILVGCVCQNEQTGRDEEWEVKYQDCPTDRTALGYGAGCMCDRAGTAKQGNCTESTQGMYCRRRLHEMVYERTEIRSEISMLYACSGRPRACSPLSQAFDVPPWDSKAG